jgi:hypothetical protein
MQFAYGFVSGAALGLVAGAFFLSRFAAKVVTLTVTEYKKGEAFAGATMRQVENVAAGVKKAL